MCAHAAMNFSYVNVRHHSPRDALRKHTVNSCMEHVAHKCILTAATFQRGSLRQATLSLPGVLLGEHGQSADARRHATVTFLWHKGPVRQLSHTGRTLSKASWAVNASAKTEVNTSTATQLRLFQMAAVKQLPPRGALRKRFRAKQHEKRKHEDDFTES